MRLHASTPREAADAEREAVDELWLQGRSHQLAGRWVDALTCYQKALCLDPNHWDSLHHLGDVLFELGRHADAVRVYRRAARVHPEPDWTLFNLGRASVELDDWEIAGRCFSRAQRLNPGLPQVGLRLAHALQHAVSARCLAELRECERVVEAAAPALPRGEVPSDPAQSVPATVGRAGDEPSPRELLRRAAAAHERAVELAEALDGLLAAAVKTEHAARGVVGLGAAKAALDSITRQALESFLLSEARLDLRRVAGPLVSVLLVLYNRCALTLACLQSLMASPFRDFEVVIVDNCSTDETAALLDRIDGATIVRNATNRHFLASSNQAAELARGTYLLFLNNDTQLLGDSIGAAVRTLSSNESIGAVGGRIILADGTLQEAGSIIWRDGSCLGYGRGDLPDEAQYMFRRVVDYCSGTFLLTPRRLFLELRGFDEAYSPAYYEETDYCVRLHKLGKNVVYDPDVSLLHYEFASSEGSAGAHDAIALQRKNQRVFVAKHLEWLSSRFEPRIDRPLEASRVNIGRRRLLYVDDRVPRPHLGSGFSRGHQILRLLIAEGFEVTVYPTDLGRRDSWSATYEDLPREVEVMNGWGRDRLAEFLRDRAGYYDVVFISRPHNLSAVTDLLADPDWNRDTKVVYDAEAIYCLREIVRLEREGRRPTPAEVTAMIEAEVAPARRCDLVLTVTERERGIFLAHGVANAAVLGNPITPMPTPTPFLRRRGTLFVGAVYEASSPNADSVRWLAGEIAPRLRTALGDEAEVMIAGTSSVPEIANEIARLGNPAIKMLGRVDDLTELYDRSRVFVAPTRFSAGIPHKVHEAAAHGLPVVATPLLAEQLGWRHDVDLMVGRDAEEIAAQCVRVHEDGALWRQLRERALERIATDCSPERFFAAVRSAVGSGYRSGERGAAVAEVTSLPRARATDAGIRAPRGQREEAAVAESDPAQPVAAGAPRNGRRPAPGHETRSWWLLRVARRSWQGGAARLVLRRALGRLSPARREALARTRS